MKWKERGGVKGSWIGRRATDRLECLCSVPLILLEVVGEKGDESEGSARLLRRRLTGLQGGYRRFGAETQQPDFQIHTEIVARSRRVKPEKLAEKTLMSHMTVKMSRLGGSFRRNKD